MVTLAEHVAKFANFELARRLNNSAGIATRWIYAVHPLPPNYVRPKSGKIDQSIARKLYYVSPNITHIVIQGTIRQQRRRYNELFRCLEDILPTHRNRFQLTMIGRVFPNYMVTVPSSLVGYAHMHPNVPYNNYFQVVSTADILIAFANYDAFGYLTYRSTSSVYTAISLGIPIVLPKELAALYPCLRAQEMYYRLSKPTDCDSLQSTLRITAKEYQQLRLETMQCHDQFVRDSTAELRSILESGIAEDEQDQGSKSVNRADECMAWQALQN